MRTGTKMGDEDARRGRATRTRDEDGRRGWATRTRDKDGGLEKHQPPSTSMRRPSAVKPQLRFLALCLTPNEQPRRQASIRTLGGPSWPGARWGPNRRDAAIYCASSEARSANRSRPDGAVRESSLFGRPRAAEHVSSQFCSVGKRGPRLTSAGCLYLAASASLASQPSSAPPDVPLEDAAVTRRVTCSNVDVRDRGAFWTTVIAPTIQAAVDCRAL